MKPSPTEGSTYQTNEHKFEAGTPRIAEAIGWSAALDWMDSFDLDAEHARLVDIASWVAEELRDMGMTVYGRHGKTTPPWSRSFIQPSTAKTWPTSSIPVASLCEPATTAHNRFSIVLASPGRCVPPSTSTTPEKKPRAW